MKALEPRLCEAGSEPRPKNYSTADVGAFADEEVSSTCTTSVLLTLVEDQPTRMPIAEEVERFADSFSKYSLHTSMADPVPLVRLRSPA